MEYTAHVTREDDWWIIRVPELGDTRRMYVPRVAGDLSPESRPVGPFAMALALVLATTDLTPAECDEVDRRLREQPRVPSATGETVTQVRAVLDAVRAER